MGDYAKSISRAQKAGEQVVNVHHNIYCVLYSSAGTSKTRDCAAPASCKVGTLVAFDV